MDDLFTFLIFALFILGPIIERVLRGGRGKVPPPGQQQRRPLPGQRPPARPLPGTYVPPQSQRQTPLPESADSTDMVPSELWEILTGQPRPPQPAERPAPTGRLPTPAQTEAEDDEGETIERASTEGRASDEESALDELLKRRERSTEVARRVEHPPPVIVSLETELALPSQRHAAFHKKVDRPVRAAAAILQIQAAPAATLRIDPGDRPALQRAIVLQQVLGKPKALE